jgi:hypothetical protein
MRRWLIPSLPDVLFVAVLMWLFAGANAGAGLLVDGDTGWHIRNGEMILRCHCVPHRDWFGFGGEGREWFAWEWLSDVIFALLHSAAGLKAVVFASGVIIAAAQCVLFRHCVWRGANPLSSLALTLVATNASTIHYLARPHLLTLLFFVVSAWLLDADRNDPSRLVWTLPPLVLLWANLHGGFLAVFSLIGARLLESVCVKHRRAEIRRIGLLAGLCAAGTLVNPYGWRLYAHLWTYLRSGWVRQFIEEFHSPDFRSESMLFFEILLVLGVATLPRLAGRRRLRDAILILFWAHQALGSVRHVPLYCIVAVPVIGVELEAVWAAWASSTAGRSFVSTLRQIGSDWRRRAQGFSLAPLVAMMACFVLPGVTVWPKDFPSSRFPSAIVNRNARYLATASPTPVRVFSTDQWSDYLIYRLQPNVQTYFDGRSDFYSTWRGSDYRVLMEGGPGCLDVLEREHARFALVPPQWPLAQMLARDSTWTVIDHDRTALLFEHR